jgi:PAS domain S-box-containing protein
LLGLVLAGFGFDQLVSSAIGDPASRSIALRIDDVTPGARSIELYREPDPPARALRFALPYELGERVWRITFSANSGYAFMEQAWGAWSLLTTALLFCGVLGGFLLLLTGRAFELERTSREAEQLLATLVQSSHDAIIAYDPQGAIVGWNEGAARSFGWQEAEALGKRAELFVPLELQAEHADLLHRAAHGEHQPTYETVRLDKQGRRLEVAAKLSPIHTADGTARGASEICRDISQEKIKDRELRASLREKEILLKEVHHRVKNNLQVISSLLNLQSSYLPTPELRGLFGESQARVQSIALVHEQLYRSKDLAHVNFEDYIRMLASGVFQAQSRIGQPITYAVEAGQIHLNVDTSVPCGLIVNELMTNALKHAFPDGRPGNILVSLQNITEDRLELNVSDDGVGLPPELDPRKTTTLGLDLVFTLADQLDAEVTVDRSPGTNFKFTFRQVS